MCRQRDFLQFVVSLIFSPRPDKAADGAQKVRWKRVRIQIKKSEGKKQCSLGRSHPFSYTRMGIKAEILKNTLDQANQVLATLFRENVGANSLLTRGYQ